MQMEDVVFSDFCVEIGVSSIREYEQEHLKQQAELEKKRYNNLILTSDGANLQQLNVSVLELQIFFFLYFMIPLTLFKVSYHSRITVFCHT